MQNKFAQALKQEDSRQSTSITENGARGFARTDSRLVDFFFKVGSMRNMPEEEIRNHFAEAYAEDPARALELLFMVRDVRGGMGEKKVFLACFSWLIKNYPGDAKDLLSLIPEYGSWKTFFDLTQEFLESKAIEKTAIQIVKEQWLQDIASCQKNGTCSLMAKWMPSENASSKSTKQLAGYWRKVLDLDSRTYRKALAKLRSAIKIVEKDMSAGNWDKINYNAVPSKAGMIYRNAFLKHDEGRRRQWLADLASGKEGVKINTTGLTVAEMVSQYLQDCPMYWDGRSGPLHYRRDEDATIEAAWRDLVSKGMLPENAQSMLPVIDGSGSMYANGMGSSRAVDVAIGLGLFLANTNTPVWRGMLMAYGSDPDFYKVPTEISLHDQIGIAAKHNDCGSTNIEAVFDLILQTCVKNGFSQKDIPTVVVFSDMEFNKAMCEFNREDKLFVAISRKWNAAGYSLPKIIFWNIASRTGTIPLTENKNGVGLLSGCSQSIMDMILSRKLDPLAILLEKLDSPRYNLIRKALREERGK